MKHQRRLFWNITTCCLITNSWRNGFLSKAPFPNEMTDHLLLQGIWVQSSYTQTSKLQRLVINMLPKYLGHSLPLCLKTLYITCTSVTWHIFMQHHRAAYSAHFIFYLHMIMNPFTSYTCDLFYPVNHNGWYFPNIQANKIMRTRSKVNVSMPQCSLASHVSSWRLPWEAVILPLKEEAQLARLVRISAHLLQPQSWWGSQHSRPEQ